ncbi:MAG TPA: hypothetical protein VF006_11975 [Longimicrobium sp.]
MLLIEALRNRRYEYEEREDLEEKNLLAANRVTPGFVIQLLWRCSGPEYESRKHHLYPHLLYHVFKPVLDGERWYVKAYLVSTRAVFISVHR